MSKRLMFLVASGENQHVVMKSRSSELFHDQLVADSCISPGEILKCQTKNIKGSWIWVDTRKYSYISFGARFLTDDAEYDHIYQFN